MKLTMAASSALLALTLALPAQAADQVSIQLAGTITALSVVDGGFGTTPSASYTPVPSLGELSVGQGYTATLVLDLASGGTAFSANLATTDGAAAYTSAGGTNFFPVGHPDSFYAMLSLSSAQGDDPGTLVNLTAILGFVPGTFAGLSGNALPAATQLAQAVHDGKLLDTSLSSVLAGCANETRVPCGSVSFGVTSVSVSAVPEPDSLILCALGLAAAGAARRARKA